MANVALIFSGQYVHYVSKLRAGLPDHIDKWGYSLKLLMSAVVAGGGLIMALFAYMQSQVVTDPECVAKEKNEVKKKKTELGISESAAFLAKSPYIRYPHRTHTYAFRCTRDYAYFMLL